MDISLSQFEKLVEEALADLPAEWSERMDNVVVVVEEEPAPEDLAALGFDPDDPEPELLGLYRGTPQNMRAADFWDLPDRISIYRGPTLREARSVQDARQIVLETVLHEIGHHFGLEEDDLPF